MTQKSRLDSEESMRKEIEIMNGFGSRATGQKVIRSLLHG